MPVRVFLNVPLSKDRVSSFMQFLLSLKGPFVFVHYGVQIGRIRLGWYKDDLIRCRDLTTKATMEIPIVVFNPCTGSDAKGLRKTEDTLKKVGYCFVYSHSLLRYVN